MTKGIKKDFYAVIDDVTGEVKGTYIVGSEEYEKIYQCFNEKIPGGYVLFFPEGNLVEVIRKYTELERKLNMTIRGVITQSMLNEILNLKRKTPVI